MTDLVNIIVPSVKIDKLLLNCVSNLLKQSHSNFIITIILDDDNMKKSLYFLENKKKIKINIIKVNNINISKKRNMAASETKSDFLAFVDSDAYPVDDWLKNGLRILKEKKVEVVTGPTGLPFPNENYLKKLINFSKRSFFLSGKWAKRKYSSENFFLDNIESCNCILKTSTYEEIDGMNENLYIGEDSEFSNRINKKFGKNKIFFSGECGIYHKDRNLKHLILQRLAWGMYMDVELTSGYFLNKIFFLLPMIIVLMGVSLFILSFWNLNFALIFIVLFILFSCLIIKDLSKFNISLFDKSICTIIILIANISYGIGSILCIARIHKIFGKKLYRKSRK